MKRQTQFTILFVARSPPCTGAPSWSRCRRRARVETFEIASPRAAAISAGIGARQRRRRRPGSRRGGGTGGGRRRARSQARLRVLPRGTRGARRNMRTRGK
ncbi:hypothetical protein L841_4214 [Mycobacterium sp. MAC_080597_8934]|nr:hypothetical protein L840_3319 [Mycobacterium sp. MAC_011194_8550]ETZ64778.1 hypothetical protein L841_4214 [Mycobacterium sp. MAC_080597_8934]